MRSYEKMDVESFNNRCSCGDRDRPHINHCKRIPCYTFIGSQRYNVQRDGSYVLAEEASA